MRTLRRRFVQFRDGAPLLYQSMGLLITIFLILAFLRITGSK